ncbi:acetyltransferase, GNAT family [Gottschalkia acidurici 9a]|uniref:Acetyltransferase, GNAT family n=1 Tax=Gottschalkia acidurici (strain ATCC 7906 / DSM 604 / BCRC 14475 / CIP 104303 / KCTC 5404 / NCIMB 10678 / 9a) TaxID=1128398 RepID=K0B171_GOTA9|nr:GNAT family N-acetyltransferase [Gottschalkia acidurici]AFS79763.1 acetyltransferase, GNAT family [Gottschalkia acidurici 9a]
MSEDIFINDKRYVYKCDYRDDIILRNSFNNLTRKTYGFDFKQWYADGYWGDKYIPYSLLNEGKVVSNVSVNIMDFLVLGSKKRFIQIGTVMTDEEYQGQGLSRALMEIVLKEWEHKCDIIYLFANDSVLDFYPKFGFIKCDEYQYSISKIKKGNSKGSRKMDMDNNKDREIVYNLACNTLPFSKISMRNNPSLIMFHCTYFMRDSIYYLKDYDTAVICDIDDDVLYLQEILSTEEVNLDTIISLMMNDNTKKIVLGFTPNDSSLYEKSLLNDEDDILFIKVGRDDKFRMEDLMFPTLSHA